MPVLLVEDDDTTRANLAEEMARDGLDVVAATSGTSAIERLRERDARFDMLVTDLHLGGGIGGLHVAEEMQRRFPRSRIVMMTGRFDLLDLRWRERGWILMPKPFAGRRLVAALRAE